MFKCKRKYFNCKKNSKVERYIRNGDASQRKFDRV